MVDGKMYVYSEEQGRVVQHRPRGDQASRWNSLESVDIGSVGETWGHGHTLMISIKLDHNAKHIR